MSQTVSMDLSAFIDRESGEFPVYLCTFSHPTLEEPLHLCSSRVTRITPGDLDQPRYGVVSRGVEYAHYPMGIAAPGQEADGYSKGSITVARDHRTIALLRSVVMPPIALTMELVMSSSPDFVRVAYPALEISDFTATAASITASIGYDVLDGYPFPSWNYDRTNFPGTARR